MLSTMVFKPKWISRLIVHDIQQFNTICSSLGDGMKTESHELGFLLSGRDQIRQDCLCCREVYFSQ